MTDQEKELVNKASLKWQGKKIKGPEGTYYVSIVYLRDTGELEALCFREDRPGLPTIFKLLYLKHNFTIL